MYSAPYKMWTAALNNVKIYNIKPVRAQYQQMIANAILNRQQCQEKRRRLARTAQPSDDA